MEYFRYTLQFLNTITFTSSTYTELDNFLNGVVKGYLNHNFGFLPIAPTEDELDELADEIGANYDLMLDDIKPRYEEVLRLGTVHTFRSKDITDSVYGDEERTGKYYEPVVSSAQAQVKTNGELTTWEDDKVTLSREEDKVLSESAIKDFFKEIKEEVELYFIDFVNIYADGTGCQKPYTLEQLGAINSGITKSKVQQIQTNKENIDLLVDAVAGITDALDDKQDKLNATQLDAVNSGIDSTKVGQIATNKNNIEQLSNPNLLINCDFRVNQRGQASYSTANKYTVDRWKLVSGSVTVETNGITLNGTITQTLEHQPSGTVTASSSAGTVSYSAGVFTLTTTEATLITWAKLEVGSIETPFSPRPYAEELAMCQRYYQKLVSGDTYRFMFIGTPYYSASIVSVPYTFPTEMRTIPTLISGGSWRVAPSTSQAVTEITYDRIRKQGVHLQFKTGNNDLVNGTSYFVGSSGDATAYVSFDAEIY